MKPIIKDLLSLGWGVCREDWKAVADLSCPLMFPAAASLHSHIYVFGGSTPATEDEGFTERAQRCVQ